MMNLESHLFSLVASTFSSLFLHTQPENVRVPAKQLENRLEHNKSSFVWYVTEFRGRLWTANPFPIHAFWQITVTWPKIEKWRKKREERKKIHGNRNIGKLFFFYLRHFHILNEKINRKLRPSVLTYLDYVYPMSATQKYQDRAYLLAECHIKLTKCVHLLR